MRYIGATKRHLATRMNEHIKGYPCPTEISMHMHSPKLDNFSVLGSCKYPLILETILIKNDQNVLSNERNSSVHLYLNL